MFFKILIKFMKDNGTLRVKVQFYSTLRNTANQDEVEMEIPSGTTVLTVLDQINKKYFVPNEAQLIDPQSKELDTGIICLINQADVNLTGGLEQKITKDGKKITLISSLHGG